MNRYMIAGFVLVNLALVVFMVEYAPESRLFLLLLLVLFVNLGMLFFYSSINSRYWTEHEKLLEYFSTFIRDKKDPDSIPEFEEFDENARFLSLFKRTYIEHKLLKKDYSDFKKVFDTFIPREIHAKIGFRGYEKIVL